jgi:RNA-directed DNA polymerase
MRKRPRQEERDKQLRLFEPEVVSFRPDRENGSGTTETRTRESMFLSLLARNRALTMTLLETVMSPINLNQAYKEVKQNGGAAGIDGMQIEELGGWLSEHRQNLINEVLSEDYQPQSVLGVEIPKPNGGTRLLGIPTVVDRMLQQAIHEQLNKLYEPLFSERSYGFRPGRSALNAVGQSSEYIKSGYEWVVDLDLENFFDTINHDRLMQRLSKGVGDKRLLRLIRRYLRAGMMQSGLESQRISGTPQGGPLSPLLSNIVLDELDKELEKRDHNFCRYADDCNIYVRSEAAGNRVLQSITRFIEKKLKLKVNREKSGVRHCSQVKFLGYTIMPEGKIRIANKSITRFKKKIKQITKRNRGVSFASVLSEVNVVMRGWVNYFRLADTWLPWRDLDGWIRRRLRCYRLKQCGRVYTVFKFLRSIGVNESKAWNAVIYGGGWWHLSAKVACRNGMSISWFKRRGLYSLARVYQSLYR